MMKHKPTIYIAIGTFFPFVGGAEMQALMQGRTLLERGYSATIVTFRHQKTWPAHDEIDGVPIIRVAGFLLAGREKLPHVFQQALYMLSLIVMGWTLWLHRHKYDILHVYQLSALTLPTALACKLANKPMIIAVRSTGSVGTTEFHEPASLIAGPLDPSAPWLQIEGQTWVHGDLDSLLRMGKPAVRYARSLLQHLHARIIMLSSRTKDYLEKNEFLLPDTQLIPNGVDTTRFHPDAATTPLAERSHIVVCVSKMRYEKGIDVLLQAWNLVQQHFPQGRLILVGNGVIQHKLERLAQELGITDSVEFAGLQKDIPAQFHRGGVAVLPSRWEGMPNALLEAMACGLPCVATRVSGSEDIIQHGVNGLLVDVEDYKEMAQALLALLRDPDLAQKYGAAARASIEQRFSLEHITDVYLDLYQHMVGCGQQMTSGELSSQSTTTPV